MEDDEEIQSPNGGRISVTVAAASNSVLTLALPIQQIGPRSGGREDCWSEEATAVLIEAWGERYLELSRGNLKQKHWKEVADIVCHRCNDYGKTPKTDIQCKNRIDTVKKKYKLERSKVGPSKWRFFDRLDHLIGPSAAPPNKPPVPVGIPVVGIRPYHHPQGLLLRRPHPSDSDSDSYHAKKPRIHKTPTSAAAAAAKGVDNQWGNSVKDLTRAILKFGEVYEQAESSKLQQMVEMEKQRMKFAKDLELQRMKFFVNTQLEISQLNNHHGHGGRRLGNNSNHHTTNNNSDSSN